MSTEQRQDSGDLEEAKDRIRRLVREVAQLSKSELAPAEYFNTFLDRIVDVLVAVGGAVWLRGESGQLELQYQHNLKEARLHESQTNQARHGRLLANVFTKGKSMLVAPHSSVGEGDNEAGNPTDYLLVVAPLKVDQSIEGIVEVLQRPGTPAASQQGYLNFLNQMCELAGTFLAGRRLRHYTDRQALYTQLENFTRSVHASLDTRETAYIVANEGRRLIDCDRVTVAIRRGGSCKVEAVSGQDTFDKRSTTVHLLNRLATAVAASGDDVWYTGDTSKMAPQVENAVQDYVDESHSKTVAVLPLKKRVKQDDTKKGEPEPGILEDGETFGVLIVEQIEDARPRDGMLQRVDVVRAHSSLSLAKSIEYDGLFLMPIWRTLGKATWVIKGRTLPKTIAIVSAVLAAMIALWVIPADFYLRGEGTLEPVNKRDVFAAVTGDVVNVNVEHGQLVQEGDVIIEMRSTQLEVQLTDIVGKMNTTEEEIRKNYAAMDARDIRPDERIRLSGEIDALRAQLESYKKQLDLLKQEQQDLIVLAPAAGRVVTSWDVLENLKGRPVERGQLLVALADPSGDWELRVEMPEDRMGHISRAREEIKRDLDVSYQLATEPGKSRVGTITDVNERAEARGEKGNTVLIKVAIKPDEIEFKRPGAGVSAKVLCGSRSLGYVWLHDVWAWTQKTWFQWF